MKTNTIHLFYRRPKSGVCALIGAALLVLGPLAPAQTTTNYTTAGNAVWVCPSNVFSIVVEATGGGGAGGNTGEANYEAAGGGAGGSFVEYTNAVTPGTSYNLTVGAGGVTNTPNTATPGGTGGSSYFGNTSAGTTNGAAVLAVGGAGGVGSGTATGMSTARLGGFAGGTASNTGNIPNTGAVGLALNIAGTSGGTSTGGNGTETSGAGGAGAGASGSSGGGAGGAAQTATGSSLAGVAGTAAGGGGSGSASVTLSKPGGDGARGQITLIYTAAMPTAGNSTETASPTSIAADNTTTSTIMVTLKDTNGDLIAGKTVVIGSSRGVTDTILPASTNTSSSGVATFTIKSGTAGSSTLTATDTTDNVTVTETATVGFTSSLIDHFTVTPSTGSANAGQIFSATVQAYSTPGSGSPISNNSVDGTPVVMTSSGLAQFDGSNNGTFANNTMLLTNGTFTINVRDPKAESVTLTASAGSPTGTSSSVSISADAMAQLQLLLPGETSAPGTTTGESGVPIAETAGTAFNITVNAVDTNWNPVTSSDTVQITASGDANVILPANTALSSGTVTLTVTNILAGSGKTLTASDVSNGGIAPNTSPSYTVVPAAASRLVIVAPGETFTLGTAPGKSGSPTVQHSTVGYSVTVDALDAYYNLATNNTDTVGITSGVGGDTLPANAALVLGTKTFSLTNNTVGSPMMTATDISNGSVTSGTTTVTVSINATTTTLASSINPVNNGVPITFTATVSSSASSRTGTVTFKNGTAVIGTSALSGNTATLTIPGGGVGTYSITATYNGDVNNSNSTSSAVSQVIQTGAVVGSAALLQDGQDYAAASSTGNPPVGRGPWLISGGTGSTSFIGILAGDLSGATSPDIRPLTNSVNPEAKLQVAKAGTNGRWYYRSMTNSVSSGSIYYSFLLNVTVNPTTTGEFMATMIPITASNSQAPTDPLSLQAREGADSSHYDLGIERLNGTTGWSADLADNTTYLVVLKYTFGSSASNSLYINPIPGAAEPTPNVTVTNDGVTAQPANIGTVLFYEAGTAETYLTSGTYQYDVMRADTTWSAVTPSITSASAVGASSLAITSSAQTFVVNTGSGLMTVTLEDQNGNPITATSNIVVNLSSSSGGGSFLSGVDDVTVVTSVTITNGTSTATFYYNDSLSGSPVVAASGGLLTSGTQTETVLPNCTPPTLYTVIGGGGYCSTGNGADVLLSDSQTTATYQLYSNSIAVGSPVVGNGSDIDFGNQLAGTYTVEGYVTGDPGCALAMSGSAVSTINYAANVAGNPTNQNVLAGYTASFTVSAGDTTSPTYQWQVSTDRGNTYNNISTGTNATYTTAATTVGINSNEFQCVISSSSGCGSTTATSTPAILQVTKAATVTVLVSSANPANAGQTITFTATVTGPGVQPTGTVTFYNGATALGTGTLSGGVATYMTTGGGPATNSITAVYNDDANNSGSTSSALSQVIQTGAAVAFPAQMQDGQDYAAATSTPETGRGAWQLVENSASATSTSFIYVSAGDLSGATVPDINPLPNQTITPPTNPPAHLTVSTPGSEGRYYYRSIGTPATNSTMYFSFLMNVSANPTGTNEIRASMLASTASNNPAATDPLTMHIRVGSDSSHYNLGIERLNGTVVWAPNSLADLTNYLIVLEYAFGSSSSNSLYINPTPGAAEPAPSASALSDGVTAQPANIGNVGFWESFDVAPDTTGTLQFDVMRADPAWANVTPAVGASGLGAASLAFSPAAQIMQVNQNSALITVTLFNQTNGAYNATTNTLVNLSTTSGSGTFRSAANGTTVISSVTISNGTSSATFYYQDSIPGTPTITGANGLLTPAVQSEVVTPNLSRLGHFTVIPSVSSTNVASVFTATVQAYDTNDVPITDDSFNGTPVTMGSSGLAQFDANGDGNYGDNVKDLVNGAFTINVRDLKAETITLTAGVGTNVATSSSVSISPGAFVQLQVLLPGETAAPGTATGKSGTPTTEAAGTGFNITVNAVDTYWNVLISGDTAHTIQSGDADVILPANTALVGGTALLTVTNILTGSGQTLTVSDVSNVSITNSTSTPYTVVAGPAVSLIVLAPGETPTFGVAPGKTGSPNAQLQTESYPLTVYALDAYYNLVQNNSDTVQITSSDGVATLPANASLSGGTKTFEIINNTQGTVTDTASDVSNGSVASGSTTLTVAPIQSFRSVQSGNWGSTSTWQYSTNGVTWIPATTTPSSSLAAQVEITNGITVTVASSVSIDRTKVDAGATLAVSSGVILTVASGSGADLDVFGTVNNAGAVTNNPDVQVVFEANSLYNHNQNSGNLPVATWNPGSTCEVTGWTTNTTCSNGMGLGQTLGNFVWNSPSQTANLSLGNSKFTGISGSFEVLSTGSGVLNIVQDGSLTNNIAGNVIVQGGDLDLCKGDGTVDFVVGGNVSVSAGGTLMSTPTTGGSGNMVFNSPVTHVFTNSGTINGAVNWIVNSNSTLDMGVSSIGGTNTMTVNPDGNLITASASGFSGNLAIPATNANLSTAGNYTYDGTVAQSGDTLLPAAVSGLTVNNSHGVTLDQAETITNLNLNGSPLTGNISIGGVGAFTVSGVNSAVIGNVSMNNGSLILVSSTNNLPDLTVESGTLNLNSGGVVLTLVGGTPVPQGSYLLVNATDGGSVSGTAPAVATVNGTGTLPALTGIPEIVGTQLYLDIVAFYQGFDAGPGFFGGENIIFTNVSGISYYVWSSSNPSLPLPEWTPEGPMSEFPFGGNGYSRYAINVNPSASPTYYVLGTTNGGPYDLTPIPVVILTTSDYVNFTVAQLNPAVNPDGVLNLAPVFASSGEFIAGGDFQFQFTGPSGPYSILASTNLTTWTVIGTGTIGDGPVTFTDTNAPNLPHQYYWISIPTP